MHGCGMVGLGYGWDFTCHELSLLFDFRKYWEERRRRRRRDQLDCFAANLHTIFATIPKKKTEKQKQFKLSSTSSPQATLLSALNQRPRSSLSGPDRCQTHPNGFESGGYKANRERERCPSLTHPPLLPTVWSIRRRTQHLVRRMLLNRNPAGLQATLRSGHLIRKTLRKRDSPETPLLNALADTLAGISCSSDS